MKNKKTKQLTLLLLSLLFFTISFNKIALTTTKNDYNPTEFAIENIPISESNLEKHNSVEENDYFTVNITEKINLKLPTFRFELLAYENEEFSCYSVEKLSIINAEDNKQLQQFYIPDYTLWDTTFTYDKENLGFELIDVNFDGYLDIQLFDTPNGNYLLEYIYLIWNPQSNMFEPDEELSQLNIPSFDHETKSIHTLTRGSGSDHFYETYQYLDGKLTLTESLKTDSYFIEYDDLCSIVKEAKNYEKTDNLFFHHRVSYKRNMATFKMELIKDVFILYLDNSDNNDHWEQILEFDTSSEIGQSIKSYFQSKD